MKKPVNKKTINLSSEDKDALVELIVKANRLVHSKNSRSSLDWIVETLGGLEPFAKRNRKEQHYMLENARAYFDLLRKKYKEITGTKYNTKVITERL